MPLVPLTIPPGVYRNGTDYQASGRWLDSNLVRWNEGVMAPVGGWRERASVATNPPRGAVAWRALNGERWLAAGTFDKLYAINDQNVATDITPTGLTVGSRDASINTGYGGYFYSSSFYGITRPDNGSVVSATTWSLDNWGENLVACSSSDGKIYEWALDTDTDAVAISGAPINNTGIVVTDERFLFALGAGGNFRRVQWSDREDNTTWTPAATNEAGDIELQTSGTILQGIRARGQTLILTDTDAHVANYIGPPFVYGFERVGTSCGSISRQSAANVDGGVMWMGRVGFYRYNGGAVERVPCDVADYVFSRINFDQISKVVAICNAPRSEVWWFYPASTENDSYVVYNYRENHWAIGSLSRTAGIECGVFGRPVWFGADGKAYDHELGLEWGGATPYAESGPIELPTGEQVMSVVELIPDEKTQGDVTATFKTRFHPNDTQRLYGPYSMANPTPVRFTGRQIAMRVTSSRLAAWQWGVPRIDVRGGGRR
jgi:hypothetical protein